MPVTNSKLHSFYHERGKRRTHGNFSTFPLTTMLYSIPQLISKAQVQHMRQVLSKAPWSDGKATAGTQSSQAKYNFQLPENCSQARQLGDEIYMALGQSALFMSAALPAKIFPPLFNCYREGQSFGFHIDNAIRYIPGTPHKLRTDLSMTLFLSEPEEYDGGELIIDDTYGQHSVKLAAGDMVIYPSTSLHRVTPVTRGARIASFFWLQSLVKSDEQRRILNDLDLSIQYLREKLGDHAEIIRLTGVYHNLLRQWSET